MVPIGSFEKTQDDKIIFFLVLQIYIVLQTKGSMKLTLEEGKELIDRVAPGRDGLYIKEDFINILTN